MLCNINIDLFVHKIIGIIYLLSHLKRGPSFSQHPWYWAGLLDSWRL